MLTFKYQDALIRPSLTESCNTLIESLSKKSTVITTTHSIGFIPKNHKKTIHTSIDNDGGISLSSFNSYQESTKLIRNSLGIRFSDYYSLSKHNVFVEGKTDKYIFEELLSIVKPKGSANKFPALRESSIIEFTGVSSIKDFLKCTYAMMASERSIISVFDGDDAGIKATRELESFFSNKNIKFRANQEYILLPRRLPIEALFPEEWIIELSETRPTWISIRRDALNAIVSIDIKGDKKTKAAEWLINKGKEETAKNNGQYPWAVNFITAFKLIDDQLLKKHLELYPEPEQAN